MVKQWASRWERPDSEQGVGDGGADGTSRGGIQSDPEGCSRLGWLGVREQMCEEPLRRGRPVRLGIAAARRLGCVQVDAHWGQLRWPQLHKASCRGDRWLGGDLRAGRGAVGRRSRRDPPDAAPAGEPQFVGLAAVIDAGNRYLRMGRRKQVPVTGGDRAATPYPAGGDDEPVDAKLEVEQPDVASRSSNAERTVAQGPQLSATSRLEPVGAGRAQGQLAGAHAPLGDAELIEGPAVRRKQLLGPLLGNQIEQRQHGGCRLQLARSSPQHRPVDLVRSAPPAAPEALKRTARHLPKDFLCRHGHIPSLPSATATSGAKP